MFVADGCNFADMRRITISFGFIGLAMMVVSLFKSAATSVPQHSDTKNAENLTEKQEMFLKNKFMALNTAGSMSTFAAGYLYYNIVTYESDVLRLVDNEDSGK
jgi:hypothetical protein